MKLKAILFDLDGTLLPQDQECFIKMYFGLLAKKLSAYGYEPKKLIDAVWHGTAAMIKNNGDRTNEEVFWDDFCLSTSENARNDIPIFDEFYKKDFKGARESCGFNPLVPDTVAALKDMGLRLVLATNPVFPACATESRIEWAGLKKQDFELCTTYENSRYSKPNPDYYKSIAQEIGLDTSECLMVGNDVSEDMVAAKTGMQVFLLTDCLINKENRDISEYPHGGFPELLRFVESLL